MKIVTILMLCLSLSGCAAVITSASADLISTRYAISKGAVEGNKLMGQGLTQQVLVKSAGVGVVLGLAHLLNLKGHQTLATVMQGVVSGIWFGTALWNGGQRP